MEPRRTLRPVTGYGLAMIPRIDAIILRLDYQEADEQGNVVDRSTPELTLARTGAQELIQKLTQALSRLGKPTAPTGSP
jgi:hypothetical protein